jgi:hypothetical protein
MRTVHLASFSVEVSGRIIQRCAICGAKLVDSLNTATCDGKPISTWAPHALVAVEGEQPQHWFILDAEDSESGKGSKIPEGFCIDLVEE